jgi:hypothetical protein
MIIRISKGTFAARDLDEVERLLTASEDSLRAALEAMPGLIHYYVGIDRIAGSATNVSLWDTMEHAHAMTELARMLAQRPLVQAAGVTFDPVTNHEMLWTITP